MAIKFIKRDDDFEELDAEELKRRHDAWASRRSREITRVRWEGTAGVVTGLLPEVEDFIARVEADGGVVEAVVCLNIRVTELIG